MTQIPLGVLRILISSFMGFLCGFIHTDSMNESWEIVNPVLYPYLYGYTSVVNNGTLMKMNDNVIHENHPPTR